MKIRMVSEQVHSLIYYQTRGERLGAWTLPLKHSIDAARYTNTMNFIVDVPPAHSTVLYLQAVYSNASINVSHHVHLTENTTDMRET